MSDPIRHECGIAVVRLLKPLGYYHHKYGSALWGLDKLHALMIKQRNRGQDGMGVGCVKLNMQPGQPYMFRLRSSKSNSMEEVFGEIEDDYKTTAKQINRERKITARERGTDYVKFENDSEAIKNHFDYGGEVLVGHLRYGTSGSFGKASCHPYLRRSNWPTRSLIVLGNFNMTNTRELNDIMRRRGQHPVVDTDTQTVLEEIGFHLDEAHTSLYHDLRGKMDGIEIPAEISRQLDVTQVISESAAHWDGGYAIAGTIGNGDAFVMRDPNAIRPCFYVQTDEYIAFASERAALRSVFELEETDTHELPAAHVAVIKSDGRFSINSFAEPRLPTPCSFERIYFSRGNDASIYHDRKALGEALVPQLLEAVGNDLANTVLSFVPNTAETAYYGLMDGLRKQRRAEVKAALLEMIQRGEFDESKIDDLILQNWPRSEKIAHKDIKSRTFISQESGRDQLVSSVYDITYGVVKPDDHLVIVDDSIVRGTTLKQSILRILARTNPRSIVVVSTAPQIRYPDCYGIDMSELGKFIAFQAAIALLKETGHRDVIEHTYQNCIEELKKPAHEQRNVVQDIYAPFTDEEISAKIAELVRPQSSAWKGDLRVIYQTVENLHTALNSNAGDWYFSGNFPTPGGYPVVNGAFIRYHEKRPGRAYDTLF
ncbi:amidophosphoribosyltransferase [Phragmitibacter flavus]|uniref:Amidophosphoribosyltransferase n=1 Tax=Phragmitibacter flavus TaxID=2576071 RepID=A0A5R8KE21_9BACT|nr:amidophosphoribosyltransferase [Phragmitibacter flavus]TLD69849.1 amidophosphoribosyltransferase [Phragmitibacter flavus]